MGCQSCSKQSQARGQIGLAPSMETGTTALVSTAAGTGKGHSPCITGVAKQSQQQTQNFWHTGMADRQSTGGQQGRSMRQDLN